MSGDPNLPIPGAGHGDTSFDESAVPRFAEDDQPTCRICLLTETEADIGRLIRPCLCRGTMAYVHAQCLANWRKESTSHGAYFRCQQCHFPYKYARSRAVDMLSSPVLLAAITVSLFIVLVFLVALFFYYLIYALLVARRTTFHDSELSPPTFATTEPIDPPRLSAISDWRIRFLFWMCGVAAQAINSVFEVAAPRQLVVMWHPVPDARFPAAAAAAPQLEVMDPPDWLVLPARAPGMLTHLRELSIFSLSLFGSFAFSMWAWQLALMASYRGLNRAMTRLLRGVLPVEALLVTIALAKFGLTMYFGVILRILYNATGVSTFVAPVWNSLDRPMYDTGRTAVVVVLVLAGVARILYYTYVFLHIVSEVVMKRLAAAREIVSADDPVGNRAEDVQLRPGLHQRRWRIPIRFLEDAR